MKLKRLVKKNKQEHISEMEINSTIEKEIRFLNVKDNI